MSTFNPYVNRECVPSDLEYEKCRRQRPPQKSGGLLSKLNFSGLDSGDIILLAVLFLLYRETRDEEFLLLLAFFGYMMFMSG